MYGIGKIQVQASEFAVSVDTITVVENACLNMDSVVHSQVETNLDFQELDNEDVLVVLHYVEVLYMVLVMNLLLKMTFQVILGWSVDHFRRWDHCSLDYPRHPRWAVNYLLPLRLLDLMSLLFQKLDMVLGVVVQH